MNIMRDYLLKSKVPCTGVKTTLTEKLRGLNSNWHLCLPDSDKVPSSSSLLLLLLWRSLMPLPCRSLPSSPRALGPTARR